MMRTFEASIGSDAGSNPAPAYFPPGVKPKNSCATDRQAVIRSINRLASPSHKSAGRMLTYALAANETATWWQLCALLHARLTTRERAAMAYMALMSLDEGTAWKTAEAALFGTDRKAAA